MHDLNSACKFLSPCEWSCLVQMEEKYGCLRMVVLWLFSSLGGESAPCLTPITSA